MQTLPYKHLGKSDWLIPAGLLAVSFIPVVAGVMRLSQLSAGTVMTAENARFIAAPMPVALHIVAAGLFSLLGAFQFSSGLRERNPKWHRASGRIVAVSGVVAALSGMWMTLMFPIPAALQGDLLFAVRLLAGAAMVLAIVMAVVAAMKRNSQKHRAWMIRGYALGQGAGMQVVVLLPWMMLVGTPSAWQRDVLMSLAWLINVIVAETIIKALSIDNFRFFKAKP
jgi:Predicted membrane protein (DUF2306)